MSDILLIIGTGTALLLTLGTFITLMTLSYQKKRLQYQEEVTGLVAAYQKEILKAQLEMQEQTFLSISQEIHDNVGQVLSLARLHISTLASTVSEQKIITTKELLDQAIQDLRDLSKRLNSKYVAQQKLPELLRHQLELIRKTGTVDTCFQCTGEEVLLNPEKKLIIFRIAQEALNNALKHAEADTITITLAYTAAKLTLRIADNGRGYLLAGQATKTNLSKGTGLYNMQYRAGLIGASLSMQSARGAGTLIALELSIH